MKDFLIGADGDMIITGNDFVMGESTAQHQQLLLITQKGEWKENPDRGVGLSNYLNDEDEDGMVRDVRGEFTKDGQTVNSLGFDDQTGVLDYDANYNS